MTDKNGPLGDPEGASPLGLNKGSSQCKLSSRQEVPAKRPVPASPCHQAQPGWCAQLSSEGANLGLGLTKSHRDANQ